MEYTLYETEKHRYISRHIMRSKSDDLASQPNKYFTIFAILGQNWYSVKMSVKGTTVLLVISTGDTVTGETEPVLFGFLHRILGQLGVAACQCERPFTPLHVDSQIHVPVIFDRGGAGA